MIKAVIVLSLAAIASAQYLRIAPQIIGASQPGQLQIIALGHGGSVQAGRRLVAQPQPISIAQLQPNVQRIQPTYQQIQAIPQIQPVQLQPIQVQPIQVQPQLIRSAPIEDEAPAPYGFSFESEDEYGTKIGRSESADGNGVVKGSYTLSDASGISRIVNYVADESGFHAEVKTNEPGTLTSNPADVSIQSSAAPGK